MPVYLSNTCSIAICDRCRFKFPYSALRPDGNSPGLRVCSKCRDNIDQYRLPARKVEKFTLRHPRPDSRLAPIPVGLTGINEGFLLTDEEGNVIQIGSVE